MTDSEAHSFWCACGVEELPTRTEDGSFWEAIRCPGCDRIWRKADLSFPAWENRQVDLRREGGGSNYRRLEDRYMTCAKRIWALFPNDPLPAACAAQSWIERLEALVEQGLLQPARCASCSPPQQVVRTHEAQVAKLQAKRKARPPLKLRGVPCPMCEGHGDVAVADEGGEEAVRCPKCGGTGEIA